MGELPGVYRQFPRPPCACLAQAAVLALLSGCSGLNGLLDAASMGPLGQSPVARGVDNGAASVLIILCPRTPQAALAAGELLDRLISHGSEIVMARGGGTARLTINACPAPEISSLPPTTTRATK